MTSLPKTSLARTNTTRRVTRALLSVSDKTGLVGAQQEWLKQAMQEYATLGLRYAEMLQGLTQQVQSHVQAAASDIGHQAAEEAEDLERTLEKTMPHAQPVMNSGHMPAE